MTVEGPVVKALGLKKMTGSSSSMAALSSPLASQRFDGMTVIRSATWLNSDSGLSECVWPPKIPPPTSMRIVRGALKSPADR
jgi:hypothetical protein